MKMGMDETKQQQSERSNCEPQKAANIQISTGFVSLGALMGEFLAGELIVLGGRPSSGKTALAIHFLLHTCLEQGIPVVLIIYVENETEPLRMSYYAGPRRRSKLRWLFVSANFFYTHIS